MSGERIPVYVVKGPANYGDGMWVKTADIEAIVRRVLGDLGERLARHPERFLRKGNIRSAVQEMSGGDDANRPGDIPDCALSDDEYNMLDGLSEKMQRRQIRVLRHSGLVLIEVAEWDRLKRIEEAEWDRLKRIEAAARGVFERFPPRGRTIFAELWEALEAK